MSLRRAWAWGIGAGVAIAGALVAAVVVTAPERGAVRTYTDLLAAANRPEPDLERLAELSTDRYRSGRPFAAASEGGVVGLPRNIHKNFKVWRSGPAVMLCPTNRVGPVYRFVRERGRWRFDGPAGLLGPDGRLIEAVDRGRDG